MLMSLWCFLIFLVRLKEVETFNMDFKGYSPSTMRSALEKNGEEIVMQVLDQAKLCIHLSCWLCPTHRLSSPPSLFKIVD